MPSHSALRLLARDFCAMEARAALWPVRHFPSQDRIRRLNCPCLFNVQQQRLQHQTATYRTTNTRLEHIETANYGTRVSQLAHINHRKEPPGFRGWEGCFAKGITCSTQQSDIRVTFQTHSIS